MHPPMLQSEALRRALATKLDCMRNAAQARSVELLRKELPGLQ